MPIEKISEGRWRIRLRYGAKLRDRFIIVAKGRAAAEARADRMTRMALALAECGKHAEAKAVLDEAGAATTEKDLLDIEAVIRVLCAESEAERAPAAAVTKMTFGKVAELFFAEQVRRGNSPNTLSKDRKRMSVLAPRLARMPVDQVTNKIATEAMALVPADAVANRHLYEGLILRVLKHALRLELIDSVPLRPDFVSKQQAPKKLFQYLRADEELRLVTGPAPIGRRLGYALMSREGVRPEFLSLFFYSDQVDEESVVSAIDLESGLLTHRHKQKRVRRWLVCERVLKVLRAWREINPGAARVLPDWDHRNIAETLRADLLASGVDRAALHRTTATERQLAAKDAGRATFVTLALRAGAPMHWVTDRTGHMTESMVNRYNRMVRESRDAVRAWLHPLDEALGAELGLIQTTERYIAPWLQGIHVADVGAQSPWPIQDLGHQMGQLIGLLNQSAKSGTHREDTRYTRTGTQGLPLEPESASASVSTSTGDTAGPAGLSQVGQADPIELALASALEAATKAERWDVVREVVAELSARRRERGGE